MRGDVWTTQASGYASKPRPAVIVQSNTLDDLDSVIVCMFTSNDTIGGPTRVSIAANESNGLVQDSTIMADKPVTVRRDRLGTHVGRLAETDMVAIDKALAIALGLSS